MEYRKVCTLWVSCLLTEKHKKSYLTTVERYAVKGDDFLHSTVTCDESWFYQFDLEIKLHMEWQNMTLLPPPPQKKPKTMPLEHKTTASAFLGGRGGDDEGTTLVKCSPQWEPSMLPVTFRHS
jgi:hypothetical protein